MSILDNPSTWNVFRRILDLTFGLYRKRNGIIREFGVDNRSKILDIGCGTGQYSRITNGEYLGIDMDLKYIEAAKKRYGDANKKFECIKLQDLNLSSLRFDVALLIDLTHHIPDFDVLNLFKALKDNVKFVVIADPVKQQQKNYAGRFVTAFDRGKFIRREEDEIVLISKYFQILEKKKIRILGIESIVVFARPR